MKGKRVMGKGLAKVEKHGIMSAGTPGAKKTVPGHTGGSLPRAGKSQTATSNKKQPTVYANPQSVRQASFTRFVN